jgi:molybdopterin-guanine dinucleotide biosynthesis protein A
VTQRPAGAIVAGGSAVRLGGIAKGLLRVGDRRIIDRVADALRPVASELLIVTNAPDADSWLTGARVVRDELNGGGAAAGVHAALRASHGPILAVAWDLPFVTRELCEALAARGAIGDADAVVPRSTAAPHLEGDGATRLEPMCAWYAPICAGTIAAMWDSGDHSMHGLLTRMRTVVLDPAVVAAAGDPARMFLNVNTESDLARAREIAGDGW